MNFENLKNGDEFELQGTISGKRLRCRKTGHQSLEILPDRGPSPSPRDAIEIYDRIIALEGVKSGNSLWPKQRFRHDFERKTKAKIYGLKDGSILIKGKKRLWKNFSY